MDSEDYMKMRNLLILLLLSIPAWGQITDYNVPRSGVGLNVCIGPGSNTMTGAPVKFSGSCLGPFAINATTFGYLDPASGNLLTNTTGAPVNSCPVFEADTNQFLVTAVRDKRPSICGGSGGGIPGGVNTQIQFNNSGVFGAIGNAAAGSVLASQGVSAPPLFQVKPFFDVRDFGNGTTNSIASTITAAGASNQAVIISPQQYAITEAVPGSVPTGNGGSGATTSNNIWIRDWRSGEYDTTVDFVGRSPSPNQRPWKQWISNYQAPIPISPIGINLTTLLTDQKSYFGGFNQNNGTYANKTNWAPLQWNMNSWTPGQHILHTNTINNYSVGDSLVMLNLVTCAGGFVAGGDEGCEAQDNAVAQLGFAMIATITSGASTGSTSLTLNISQGSSSQGQGRYLIDTTQAITSGTISSISAATPPVVTGSGTTWPVSTVNTTLGTAVNAPGSVTVTPGSITGITTSSLLCIADGNAFEMLIPSAVVGSTFTATFTRAHPGTATVASGGLCGYGMEMTADRVTVTGVIRLVYPVIVSTSATSATLWVNSNNGFGTYIGNFSASRNNYAAYPEAEVVGVASGGSVSNTLTLGPNSVAWATSDGVEEPLYPVVHMTMGNNSFTKYFPSPSNQASYIHQENMLGIWSGQAGDALYYANNQTNNGYYDTSFNGTATLGNFQPPHYAQLFGNWVDIFALSGQFPANGVIHNTTTTSGTIKFINTAAVSGHDEFDYSTSAKQWVLTTNGTNNNYIFDVNGIYINHGTAALGTSAFPWSNLIANQTTLQDPGPFGSTETYAPSACETSFGITTLSTGSTTTNTGLNCLPANAIIDSVVYRVTTSITTAANFTIGDSTTAARFCATQTTINAGNTGVCFAQADQTGAAGPRQTAAASVRVTTNVNPGAGAMRLIVYYHTWNPPTS